MTQEREPFRQIKNQIDNSINNNKSFSEAIILDWQDISKMAKVKILPENLETWARMSTQLITKDSGISMSPIKDAHCIIAYLSKNDIQKDLPVIIAYLYDDNNKVIKENDGKDDKNYVEIKHPSGAKIDIFKDSSDKKHLLIKSFNFIDMESADKINLKSDNVSLGDSNLTGTDKNIVTKPHLDIFNSFVDTMSSFINTLINQPTLGDMGIPLPLSVRNPALVAEYATIQAKLLSYQIKENPSALNKTSKTRAT